MHTIVERKANSGDFHLAGNVGKLGPREWGCAVVGFGLLPAIFFGVIGRNSFGFWGLIGGALLGAAIFLFLMYASWRQRTEQRDFVTHGDAQEITVDRARCFEIDLHNSDPILAFDIGLDTILVLQGQWLFEAETYGHSLLNFDPIKEFFNGLPSPYSFPSSKFSIVRNPANGDVIAVRPNGEYLKPLTMEESLYADRLLPQSQLVPGSSDDLIKDVLNGTDLSENA